MKEKSEEGLFKGSVLTTSGFGFVEKIIFDTHFMAQGTDWAAGSDCYNQSDLYRGWVLVKIQAVVLKGDGVAEVVGTGQVIIVDGSDIGHSNIMDIKPGEPIAVENVRIHSLVNGYGYNFKKRQFLTPPSH